MRVCLCVCVVFVYCKSQRWHTVTRLDNRWRCKSPSLFCSYPYAGFLLASVKWAQGVYYLLQRILTRPTSVLFPTLKSPTSGRWCGEGATYICRPWATCIHYLRFVVEPSVPSFDNAAPKYSLLSDALGYWGTGIVDPCMGARLVASTPL